MGKKPVRWTEVATKWLTTNSSPAKAKLAAGKPGKGHGNWKLLKAHLIETVPLCF